MIKAHLVLGIALAQSMVNQEVDRIPTSTKGIGIDRQAYNIHKMHTPWTDGEM